MPADTDLTTRARAVLADLDVNRRAVIIAAGWETFIPRAGLGEKLVRSLQRRQILRKCSAASYRLTELGREVARLLAEGAVK